MTGNREKACDLITMTYISLREKDFSNVHNFVNYFSRSMSILKTPEGRYTQFRNSLTINSNFAVSPEVISEEPDIEEKVDINLSCLDLHEKILIELTSEGMSAAAIARELKHDGVEIHQKLISNMLERARKKIRQCNHF